MESPIAPPLRPSNGRNPFCIVPDPAACDPCMARIRGMVLQNWKGLDETRRSSIVEWVQE